MKIMFLWHKDGQIKGSSFTKEQFLNYFQKTQMLPFMVLLIWKDDDIFLMTCSCNTFKIVFKLSIKDWFKRMNQISTNTNIK